jgi:hypothetical protein
MLEKAGEIWGVILSELQLLMRVLVNDLLQEWNWHKSVNVPSLKLMTAFVCIMSNVPLMCYMDIVKVSCFLVWNMMKIKNTHCTKNNNDKTKPLTSMTILFRKFLTMKTSLTWKCDIQKDCRWFTPWQSTQTMAKHSLLSKYQTLSWYMCNHYLHLCRLSNYGLPCTDGHETHKCPTSLRSYLLSRILLKLDIKYRKNGQKFHLHF